MTNKNNLCPKKDCGPSKTYKCLDCTNYKRKVNEAERIVSARDVLIEMLQNEIKKMENLYKNSIDDYEKLRFNHCTTVHQLSNLREIHKKLKNEHAKVTMEKNSIKSHLCALEKEMEKYRNQYKISQNQQETIGYGDKPTSSSYKDIIKEVINIESNIENENRRLKDLMYKLLDEAQNDRSPQIEHAIDNNISESKCSRELVDVVTELNKRIETLNNFAATLKSENDTIKYQLTEKISNLSSCLRDVEKNYSNITSLSETIGNFVGEKENYIQEIKDLKNTIEENNQQLKEREEEILKIKCECDDMRTEVEKLRDERLVLQNQFDQYMLHAEELQRESSEKEKTWDTCKSKLIGDYKELEQNYNCLHETLVTLTNENISRLEEIAALNQNLDETSGLSEQCDILKQQNLKLTEEIEEYKKKQQEKENEADLKTSKIHEDIDQLNDKIKSLERQLEELTLENSEYEEENRYYCQQLEKLISQLRGLENEKLNVDADNEKCCKIIDDLKRDYERLDFQKENELKQLKEEINEMKTREYLYESEKDNEDSKNKISLLEDELKGIKSLKENIENDNSNLNSKIRVLERELQDSEKNNEDSKNKIALMEDELKKVKSLTAKIENENENLKSEINNFQTKYGPEKDSDDTSNKIALMEEELKKVKSLKAQIEHENDTLKNQINNLERELADIHESTENQIFDLQGKLHELEKQHIDDAKRISTCDDQLHRIKQSADEQKLEDEKYVSMLKSLEEQKVLMEKEQIKLDNETQQNLEEVERLKKRIQECNEKAIKNQNEMKVIISNNEKLHEEIEAMGIECCREERLINHLEQCIEASNKMLEECERELKQMHIDIETLKQENDILKTNLKRCCEAEDNESREINLEDQTDEVLKQNQQLHSNRVERPETLTKLQDETTNTTDELNKTLERNKEKDEELSELRKQLEFIRKSAEIYKSEYEKLKKAYTEIKASVAQRIKEFHVGTQTSKKENIDIQIHCQTELTCGRIIEKQIKEMEQTITENEMLIKNLQHHLTQSSQEVCQLNGYVNKLIADNRTLKQGIENLLNTLVDKFRDFSDNVEDIEESFSARIIMQDILDSLIYFEKHICGDSKYKSGRCNCISVISSQYKPDVKTCTANAAANKTSCKEAITVVKKCDDMSMESISEILEICTDCCSRTEHVCDNLSSEHEERPTYDLIELEVPEATDEPNIIEPYDDS